MLRDVPVRVHASWAGPWAWLASSAGSLHSVMTLLRHQEPRDHGGKPVAGASDLMHGEIVAFICEQVCQKRAVCGGVWPGLRAVYVSRCAKD